MQPEFEIITTKKLVGLSKNMSMADNKTLELFSTFMPKKKEIANAVGTFVYDLRVFPKDYFLAFNPAMSFKKYALVEVTDYIELHEQMEQFTLEGGKYAVFTHRGKSADFEVFEYIFTKWLPKSDYQLDDRPHFEKLIGNKNNSHSENYELIYIPVCSKN